MKSRTQSEKSTEAPVEPTTVSVYDFIYHDARRIASFLSQFDESGHLTQISRSAKISQEKTDVGKANASVGIAGGEMTRSASDQHGRESQRIYDPMWANARVFLDYLDEAGRIQRDIPRAQIGQFVLVSGTLAISDLQLMEQTWRLESVKSLMLSGFNNQLQIPDLPKGQRNNPHLLNAKRAAEQAAKAAKDGINLFFDLIKILPHTIQARLVGSEAIWCSLARDGMTFDASDLVLKYGTEIPGNWSILGILDANPDDLDLHSTSQPSWGNGEEMAVKMVNIIAPVTRNFLGRPADFYGVTPLLIFREIAR